MDNVKHVIWSNQNLDIEDWRDDYQEYLEENGFDERHNNDDDLYKWMMKTNDDYFYDEIGNLNIQLNCSILVIADIGRWNGRSDGYKEIKSGNIQDCLSSECDYVTWYVDEAGDMRCDATHHDGTNHYLYRVYKAEASEEQIEDLKDKIYEGKATREDIERVTDRLGDEIGKVYGWEFPPVQEVKEPLAFKIKAAANQQPDSLNNGSVERSFERE